MSELANNQARFTLTIDGAPGSFNVLRWQCAEGISSLYQARVEALADEPSAPHDLLGKSALLTVHSAEGTDLLKATAEQAAATWTFRRTAIDRLNLIATFSFTAERAVAKVQRAP